MVPDGWAISRQGFPDHSRSWSSLGDAVSPALDGHGEDVVTPRGQVEIAVRCPSWHPLPLVPDGWMHEVGHRSPAGDTPKPNHIALGVSGPKLTTARSRRRHRPRRRDGPLAGRVAVPGRVRLEEHPPPSRTSGRRRTVRSGRGRSPALDPSGSGARRPRWLPAAAGGPCAAPRAGTGDPASSVITAAASWTPGGKAAAARGSSWFSRNGRIAAGTRVGPQMAAHRAGLLRSTGRRGACRTCSRTPAAAGSIRDPSTPRP